MSTSTEDEIFYVGKTKVTRTPEGHFWVQFRPGRSRLALKGSDLWNQVENGRVSLVERIDIATGTFTPVVYFKTEDGKIGIPPTPTSPIPANAIRYEARTLRDIDNVTREMNIEDRKRFEEDGSFNEGMVNLFGGGGRDELQRRMSQTNSNMERDFIRIALENSYEEDRKRQSFTGSSYFHQREWDS